LNINTFNVEPKYRVETPIVDLIQVFKSNFTVVAMTNLIL